MVKVRVKVPKKKRVKSWESLWKYVWKTVIVWEYEWRTETQYIIFTINQVMKGLEDLYDELMKKLEEEVNKVLDPILDKLDLNIDFDEMLGLDKIEKEINKLRNNINIGFIDVFEENLLNLVLEMDKIVV
jgi:hypothetical protein